MRLSFLLPLLIVIFFVSDSKAQNKDKERSDDMVLIYSSEWDWDWHCNCRAEKERSKYKAHVKDKNDGIETDVNFFSHIGPNPAVYGFSPQVNAIHYNRVNGLFLGLDTEFDTFIDDILTVPGFDLQALGGYSFGQERWQYHFGVERLIGRKFKLGVDLYNITNSEDTWRVGQTENSLNTLFAGYDYKDYFGQEGYSIHGSLRVMKSTYLGSSYSFDTYNSLDAVTSYNVFGDGNIGRFNPAIDSDFDLIKHQTLGFSLNVNPMMFHLNRQVATNLVIRTELGKLPVSENEYSYNKFIIQTKSFISFDRFTSLKLRLMGGAITGDAPDFKNFALGGIGTMRATGYKSLQGNAMLLGNAELIFGRNAVLDLGFFEVDGFYFSLFMDSGWSGYVAELETTNDPTMAFADFRAQDLTHNVGIGVGSDKLRLEFAKPIKDEGGFSAFWIRLNPTF